MERRSLPVLAQAKGIQRIKTDLAVPAYPRTSPAPRHASAGAEGRAKATAKGQGEEEGGKEKGLGLHPLVCHDKRIPIVHARLKLCRARLTGAYFQFVAI